MSIEDFSEIPAKKVDGFDERLAAFVSKTDVRAASLPKGVHSRYKLIEKIGEGGLKEIFKAFDPRSKRFIAIAFPKHADKSHVERFVREARITAILEHPNIIPVYDIDEDNEDRVFFTMKLVTGKNMRELIALSDHSFTVNQILRVFVKICDAVNYAHNKGIVHLDLKPENIFINEYGEVMIFDWGQSKRMFIPEEDDSFIMSDVHVIPDYVEGTPGFMAPEQYKPRDNILDEKTDLFALGCILYFILNKREINESTENLLNGLDEVIIPESLSSVIQKAVKEKPSERYEDVSELQKEIELYLDGFPTEAEKAPFLKQFLLLILRNKKEFITLIVSMFLLFLVVFLSKNAIKNREVKIESFKDAIAKTEESFKETSEKLEIEKKSRLTMQKSSAESLASTDLIPYNKNYNVLLNQLNQAYRQAPQNSFILQKLIILNICVENYRVAVELYEKNRKLLPQQYLVNAIEIIKKLPQDDLLEIDDFVNLVTELRYSQSFWIASLLCIHKVNQLKGKETHILFMKNVLESTNKLQDNIHFRFQTDDGVIFQYIDLSRMSSFYCYIALSGRYIGTLDLTGVDKVYCNDLSMLYVKTLILKDCKVFDLNCLKKIRSLENVIVRKGQLSPQDKMDIEGISIFEVD